MPFVEVKFQGMIRGGAWEQGTRLEVASGATVEAVVLRFLAEQSVDGGLGDPDRFKDVLDSHAVMLNGRGVWPHEQGITTVQEGDNVMVFLPIVGG